MYKVASCLHPRAAASFDPPSLGFLFDEIPQLSKFADKKMEDIEWRKLYLDDELSAQFDTIKYWTIVFSRKNDAGLQCYPNLNQIMSTLLSLPFSNASAERFFSQLNLTKTPERTRLKNETVRGLMHSVYVYCLKNKELSAHSMQIGEKLLKAINNIRSDATCSESEAI